MTRLTLLIAVMAMINAGSSKAAAQSQTFAEQLADWADTHAMSPVAAQALDNNGTVLESFGDVAVPMPIASISKTLAGQCALTLAERGLLARDARLGDVLGWDGPQGEVTVDQLLTHTSGFGPDKTQEDVFGRNLTSEARIAEIVASVAKRPIMAELDAGYFYNNENYLVLEAAMRAVLDVDPVLWCAENTPLLAEMESLGRADITTALGLAGGLEVSARDLVILFQRLRVGDDWPLVPMNGRNVYGPGVIVQTVGAGQNLFHVGGVCIFGGPGAGAFGVQLASGNSVAVLYSGCADQASLGALNGLILEHFGR